MRANRLRKTPPYSHNSDPQHGADRPIPHYLSQVMNDGDTDELLEAIAHIAKARGMSTIAQQSGLGRESLYKAFAPGSKPRFETVMKVIHSLGIQLQAAVHIQH